MPRYRFAAKSYLNGMRHNPGDYIDLPEGYPVSWNLELVDPPAEEAPPAEAPAEDAEPAPGDASNG